MTSKGFARLAALLVTAFAQGGALQAQPAARTDDAKAVTSVTYQEVRQALADVGILGVGDHTADANFPSFGGRHSAAVTLQATLHACDTAKQRCRGVNLTAIVPATSRRSAQVVTGPIERATIGIDARVINYENRPGAAVVLLSSYLVYDHGVSDRLLAVALDQFSSAISQSKALMLRGDPGHADLWGRQN